MAEAVAPVSFTASLTLAKTGRSRCMVPAFLGLVPPTTFVPVLCKLLFGCDRGWTNIYRRRWPAQRGSYVEVKSQHDARAIVKAQRLHLRSLLSSETLEENAGVLVDLKVVQGLAVGRGGLSPTLGGTDIAKGREGVTAEGLHCCKIVCLRGEVRYMR